MITCIYCTMTLPLGGGCTSRVPAPHSASQCLSCISCLCVCVCSVDLHPVGHSKPNHGTWRLVEIKGFRFVQHSSVGSCGSYQGKAVFIIWLSRHVTLMLRSIVNGHHQSDASCMISDSCFVYRQLRMKFLRITRYWLTTNWKSKRLSLPCPMVYRSFLSAVLWKRLLLSTTARALLEDWIARENHGPLTLTKWKAWTKIWESQRPATCAACMYSDSLYTNLRNYLMLVCRQCANKLWLHHCGRLPGIWREGQHDRRGTANNFTVVPRVETKIGYVRLFRSSNCSRDSSVSWCVFCVTLLLYLCLVLLVDWT